MWDRKPMADYMREGWTISTTFALDFSSISEHDMKAGKASETEQAMASIGRILSPFDPEGAVDLWGFSGVPEFSNESHKKCWAFSGDMLNPEMPTI